MSDVPSPPDEKPTDTGLLELGRRVLAAQPFSRLLGARLERLTPSETVLLLHLRPELQQQAGRVHGGVLAYLADNAITFAAGAALGPDVVTAEVKINYLRPAAGRSLVARATLVHAGRQQAVCRCDIEVDDEAIGWRLCATALGSVVRLARPATAA